jgi:threonine aldolase
VRCWLRAATKGRINQVKPNAAAVTDTLTDEERHALRAGCERRLQDHGVRGIPETLAELAVLPDNDLQPDQYGEGGVVAVLEREVCDLLGKPSSVFMPSGIMAQQIALRVHADRRGRQVIAFHPTCHLELHEDKAYQRLHGLVGRTVGDARRLVTLGDLEAVREPLAALVIELPQREIGGRLPAWEDLVAQVGHARDRGAAAHLDGARLWEAQPFYGRPLAEIAALFDTVYVSFYKGLGAPAGSMLLGETDVISEARAWRKRHGGTLFALWPYAAASLAGLRSRLPKMALYVDHARAIAEELARTAGVTVVPDPPHTNMMHLHLRTTEAAVTAGIRRLASERSLWAFGGGAPLDTPGLCGLELTVGDATLAFTPDEVADIVHELLPRARTRA